MRYVGLFFTSVVLLACSAGVKKTTAWHAEVDACPPGASLKRGPTSIACVGDNDMLHGRIDIFAADGVTVVESGTYWSGVKDGVWTRFVDGRVFDRYELSNRSGRIIEWRSDATVGVEYDVVAGKKHGAYIEWSNGNPKVKRLEGTYDRGVQVGEWVYRSDEDKITNVVVFRDGKVVPNALGELVSNEEGLGGAGLGSGGGAAGWGTLGTGKGRGKGVGFGKGTGKAVPTVRSGNVTASAALDKAIIRRYIRRQHRRVRLCYEKQLELEPTLEGTVTVTFQIGRDGTVATSSAEGLGNEKVEACIAETIRSITFPRPKSGIVKVRYPFVLTMQRRRKNSRN